MPLLPLAGARPLFSVIGGLGWLSIASSILLHRSQAAADEYLCGGRADIGGRAVRRGPLATSGYFVVSRRGMGASPCRLQKRSLSPPRGVASAHAALELDPPQQRRRRDRRLRRHAPCRAQLGVKLGRFPAGGLSRAD